MWRKKQNTDGVRNVSQRQNRKSYSCPKFPLTRDDDNTNVRSVDKYLGCKEEDHQLNRFTKNCDQNFEFFVEKLCIQYHHLV
jgi:hypothetical protein